MTKSIGKYEIIKKLGAGGMAEIFLARQTGVGGFSRLVCIKRILSHLGERKDFVDMFWDEAQIAAQLNHPNIVQVYDVEQDSESIYIIMEYIRGEDLRRVYNQEVHRGHVIPPTIAAHVGMTVASGLDFAHRQTGSNGEPLGIVHRDISPQNVIISYEGYIKLVDFGVAKAYNKVAQTKSGVLKGKYSYMSPEQATGDKVDGRSDVFALGITLYEVTTGTRLFKKASEVDTLNAVVACEVTPPSQVLPQYDTDLEAILMRALKRDPDQRYQTAGEMEADLENYLHRRGRSTSAATLAEYMHDLFADKLADEALFGGSPWDETHTRKPKDKPPSGMSHQAFSNDESAEDLQRTPKRGSPTMLPESMQGEASVAAAIAEWTQLAQHAPPHDDDDEATLAIEKPKHQQLPVEPTKTKILSESALSSMTALGAKSLQKVPSRLRQILAPLLVMGLLLGGFLVLRNQGFNPLFLREPRTGAALIDSEPRGSQVTFSGNGARHLNRLYRDYRTPFEVGEGFPVGGKIVVHFSKDGYQPIDVMVPRRVEHRPPLPLFVQMMPAAKAGADTDASLVIISTPDNATIWIDGNDTGTRTPVSNFRIKGGQTHQIELRHEGYVSFRETLWVQHGSRRFVEAELLPDGRKKQDRPLPSSSALPHTLRFTPPAPAPTPQIIPEKAPIAAVELPKTSASLTVVSPIKMEVWLNDKHMADAPMHEVPIPPGNYTMALKSHQEGSRLERSLKLTAGQSETVTVSSTRGILEVNATPWAWVQVGTHTPRETPVVFKLYEGDYELLFECPEGTRKKQTARITPGTKSTVMVRCEGE